MRAPRTIVNRYLQRLCNRLKFRSSNRVIDIIVSALIYIVASLDLRWAKKKWRGVLISEVDLYTEVGTYVCTELYWDRPD